MFAEEEWNDNVTAPAATLTQCGNTDSNSMKDKVTARTGKKKSLLKTLQTLGSVPDWSTCSAPQDSESEDEAPTAHPKKKKKRCKKRKRGPSADRQAGVGDNQDGSDIPRVIKKQKITPQVKASKNVTGTELVSSKQRKDAQVDEGTKNSIEKPLSRQQWKNRMKNKRKCKNKYQEKNHQHQHQKALKSETGQEKGPDNTSSKPRELELCNVNNVESKKTRKEKGKKQKQAMKKGASSISNSKTDHIVTAESLIDSSNITKDDLDTNLSKASEKTETLNPSEKRKQKEKQKRADKLRHMLNSQRSEGKVKSSEEREKSVEKETEEDDVKNEGQTLDRSAALRSKMEERLKAARFRYINEVLYTTSSSEAKRMFQQDPNAFEIYHLGFTTQVQHWPENPVDAIISFICQKPISLVVADFGCGDCKIARNVKNKVHSFDLAPTCDLVTVCDMAKVPLGDGTVDIAVFCLSLMGTNLSDFLAEANRVLVLGGVLKIAEVASRFENVRAFIGALSSLGFKLTSKDTENNYFYLFEFVKVSNPSGNTKKSGLTLKPCVYKKR